MSIWQKRLQQFWAQEKSLTILFFILVVHIFIIIPFGQKTVTGQIIFLVFYISLLSAGMFLLVKSTTIKKNTDNPPRCFNVVGIRLFIQISFVRNSG